MWKLCDLLSAEIGPKLCETRRQDGQLAMCINPDAQYGHGHGPLWAVENQCVQFSTQRSLGYVEGVCRKVLPKVQRVIIEVTRGPTWGVLAMGELASIHVRDIRRYHCSNVGRQQLVTQSQQQRCRVLAEQAFVDISIHEMQQAIAREHSQVMASLVGQDVFDAWQHAAKAYLSLCKSVDAVGGERAEMASAQFVKGRRAMRSALARLAVAQIPGLPPVHNHLKAKTTKGTP